MAGGRPKGLPKTGGRKKGVINKTTRLQAEAIRDSGLTPLEYFTMIFRDEERDHTIRLDAAKAAAPYVHPRLSSIEHGGKGGEPITVVLSREDEGLL